MIDGTGKFINQIWVQLHIPIAPFPHNVHGYLLL